MLATLHDKDRPYDNRVKCTETAIGSRSVPAQTTTRKTDVTCHHMVGAAVDGTGLPRHRGMDENVCHAYSVGEMPRYI